LNVHSKSQAVLKAIDLGFLPQVQLNQDLIDEFGKRKQLSQREINVLHLFHEGLNKKEIAEKLGLTMNEVMHACKNITSKLRAQDMIQVIARGLEIE
jgi:DNA-binding NarL/FixJ family response regulator